MRVDILGVGILSSGLEGWSIGREVLAGNRSYRPGSIPAPEAALLPPNERRRSSEGVRWAVQVAHEAIIHSGIDPREVATVFASSGGEMDVLDRLCRALATRERVISPTLFHQSVHNTAAGYWGIATSCQQSSTALSCYDDSVVAGLLDAVAYACVEDRPVLFVSYDLPVPELFNNARPITSAFASALVLTNGSGQGFATLIARLVPAEGLDVTIMPDQDLERLRLDNPAARLLPVLRILATRQPRTINLNLLDDQRLVVEIKSCHP